MKKLFLTLILLMSSILAFTQSMPTVPEQNISAESAVAYRLFATKNIYTFIKLDTRNGKMWQVQWSLGEDAHQIPLSLNSLVSNEEEKNGRFFLYPTTNIFNFILLDQMDGRVWQVQWNSESKNRFILPIK